MAENNIFQNNYSKLFAETNSVAVFTTRISDGVVVDGNKYFVSILGFKTLEDLISAKYSILKLYSNLNKRNQIIEKLKTEKILKNIEIELVGTNGINKVVASMSIDEENGFIYSIIIDNTEKENSIKKLKENEERLVKLKQIAENSNKSKSTFLANMSHEFRTPMNSILGMSELLLKTDLTEKQFNFLNIITKSAENLLVIINDILDFSKIESGELVFENISFRLKDTIANVINSTFYRAQQKGIELNCNYLSFGGDGYIIKTDPVRLNQILLNLVDNAVKFTEKGKVEIKIKKIEENDKYIKLNISVEDTGIGIEKAKIESIQTSFTQGDVSTNRKYGGTGLGLTISKHLIEMMGSKLLIRSEKNVGSIFSFEVEFKKGSYTEFVANKEIEIETNIKLEKNIKILLAEDEAFNQIVVKSMVEYWGFEIEIAENGNKAIELLSKKCFDIILMDIQMPELDGIETTKIIRTQFKEPINKIPIIAVTANAYTDDHQKFHEAGINDIISKPFKSQILFNKIVDLLNTTSYKKEEPTTEIELDADKIYNLNVVTKISKGDDELLIKMLTVFKEKSAIEIKEMLNAVYEEEWEQVSIIAHKFKPSVAYLGMADIEMKMTNIVKWGREKTNLIKIKMYAEFTNEVLKNVYNQIDKDIELIRTQK